MAASADLHAELWRAVQIARLAAGAKASAHVSVLPFRRVQWGFDLVTCYGMDREFYEPQPDGRPAIIAPVIEDGDTIDLVAIDPDSQHVATRLGLGHGLGFDALDDARMGCCALKLVERPLQWLRDPWDVGRRRASLYLFKLSEAPRVLAGVSECSFSSTEFAERVWSLFPPSEREDDEAPP